MVDCNNDNFKKALDYLFEAEGGYSNHKNDRGGATNFGITQRTYDFYQKRKGLAPAPVKQITKQEAAQIYYEDYWIKSGADKIEDFSIALILFDSCVNHGVSGGISLYKKAGNNSEKFLNLRREKYKAIAENNSSQKVFLKGWLNRVDKLEKYIKKEQEKK